jgi:hypothetical protein
MTTCNEISPRQAAAYGRVMAALRTSDVSDLEDGELLTLREACDALVLGDGDADTRLEHARDVCTDLVVTGRWAPESAERLRRDVESCARRAGDVPPGLAA